MTPARAATLRRGRTLRRRRERQAALAELIEESAEVAEKLLGAYQEHAQSAIARFHIADRIDGRREGVERAARFWRDW